MTQKLDCPQSLKVSATPEYDDTRHNRAKDAGKSPAFIQIIIIIVIIRWSSHINIFKVKMTQTKSKSSNQFTLTVHNN